MLLRGLFLLMVVIAAWLSMQQVHEAGHVLGAAVSGGKVERVVLAPWMISRTDLSANPRPLVVVWAGPLCGVLAPLCLWGLLARTNIAFLTRFFAGFCLVANGAYIGGGSFAEIGDCGEMLRHGAAVWQLWLFGSLTVPAGFTLWNGQGPAFARAPSRGSWVFVAIWLAATLAVGVYFQEPPN